ncbi:MAG: FRG domain-containing protein [Caulobacterales bacterium]
MGPPAGLGNSLYDALIELLQAPVLTADLLETAVQRYPELLGQDAQMWLSLIREAQPTSDARNSVDILARLLDRLGKEDRTAVFSDEGNRFRRENAARLREARLAEAREAFLRGRERGTAGPAPDGHSTDPLPSLTRLVEALRTISRTERARPYGRDLLNRAAETSAIPALLFRGESGAYKSTSTSMRRLTVAANAIDDIARVRDSLVAALGAKCGLTGPQALGFLQHYGYPTDYLDFTSDPSVAASFASNLRVGDSGAICIMPTAGLGTSLIDLRDHPLAKRPQLQSAFALHVPDHPDLKAPEAVEALRLTWISFQFSALDAARFVPDLALLDARSDEIAGLLWLFINDCAKFSDKAVKLLSERLAKARVSFVTRSDGTVALVSEDAVAPQEELREADFERSAYEYWSDAFPAPAGDLPAGLEAWIQANKQRLSDAPPGTIVQVLSSRGINGLGVGSSR